MTKLGHQALDAIVAKTIRYIVMSKDLSEPEKHLTPDEQRMFQRALRRSVKVVND